MKYWNFFKLSLLLVMALGCQYVTSLFVKIAIWIERKTDEIPEGEEDE